MPKNTAKFNTIVLYYLQVFLDWALSTIITFYKEYLSSWFYLLLNDNYLILNFQSSLFINIGLKRCDKKQLKFGWKWKQLITIDNASVNKISWSYYKYLIRNRYNNIKDGEREELGQINIQLWTLKRGFRYRENHFMIFPHQPLRHLRFLKLSSIHFPKLCFRVSTTAHRWFQV